MRVIRLDIDVLVVAVEGEVNDWAAYIGSGNEEKVKTRGTKLPYDVAKVLFPDWDERLAWRY